MKTPDEFAKEFVSTYGGEGFTLYSPTDARYITQQLGIKLTAYVAEQTKELREALEASQKAMIGLTQELGAIEAKMPGWLPYGIKSVKTPVDIQVSRNAAALSQVKGE